jgi:hypothetical protein
VAGISQSASSESILHLGNLGHCLSLVQLLSDEIKCKLSLSKTCQKMVLFPHSSFFNFYIGNIQQRDDITATKAISDHANKVSV